MNDDGERNDDPECAGDSMLWRPEIPRDLHSDYTGAPFDACIECGRALLASATVYAIQKDYQDGECVLEFAICLSCMESMNGDWSEESRNNVESFLAENSLRMAAGFACDLCGTLATDCGDDFALAAIAFENHLLDQPHRICGSCKDRLAELLSEETRRGMDDFTERNFPGVPAGIDLPAGFIPL